MGWVDVCDYFYCGPDHLTEAPDIKVIAHSTSLLGSADSFDVRAQGNLRRDELCGNPVPLLTIRHPLNESLHHRIKQCLSNNRP